MFDIGSYQCWLSFCQSSDLMSKYVTFFPDNFCNVWSYFCLLNPLRRWVTPVRNQSHVASTCWLSDHSVITSCCSSEVIWEEMSWNGWYEAPYETLWLLRKHVATSFVQISTTSPSGTRGTHPSNFGGLADQVYLVLSNFLWLPFLFVRYVIYIGVPTVH